jgi:2-keto-3-deoxy-L-rhamnonate aldolase RhmA
MHMEEYIRTANEEILTIPMIEHFQAVENIEEIVRVPGIDAVMVGALDLSGSMGILGQTAHPDVEAAIQKVLAACRGAGVPAGIIAGGAEQANLRIAQGFRLLIVGLDVLFLIGAARGTLDGIVRQPELAVPVSV